MDLHMKQKLDTVTVFDLMNNSFYIPDYQRGYRWTRLEVEKLLGDLEDFYNVNTDGSTFCCMQPLVVFFNKEQDAWEVIDGQQRLTTMYLILNQQKGLLEQIYPDMKLFNLSYQSRPDSRQYLENIDSTKSNSNIDYYHMFNASAVITDFLKKTTLGGWRFVDAIVNANNMESRPSVKFIWYNVTEEIESKHISPEEKFSDLNIGKIGLTNAELIKALFLNNVGDDESESLRIASEWDSIEHALQDDSFWSFIYGKDDNNSYNLANYTDTFCTSIAGLHYLCCEDIVSEIAQKDLSVLATLDIPQIEEEILKMKLSSNPSWGNAIDNAEKDLSYFEGRLRYSLIECCGVDENDIADILKIALFIDYVEKIASIFINASGCPFESELIRAMLSKGDYLMYFNSNNTLLKNADRDNSWRRFLKEKASDNNAYHPYGMVSCDLRDYFRAVIDDPLFDKSNAKSSLLAIAQARDSSIPMWRKLIIDCADILNNTEVNALGKDRFLRWNNETTQYPHKKDSEDNYEIDLIPGSAITGYHAELFSLCKYYELKGKTFGALGSVIYQRAKTNIEQPYFYLGNEDEPIVKVMYQDDCCFRFLMADGTEECNIAFDDVEARLLAINP